MISLETGGCNSAQELVASVVMANGGEHDVYIAPRDCEVIAWLFDLIRNTSETDYALLQQRLADIHHNR